MSVVAFATQMRASPARSFVITDVGIKRSQPQSVGAYSRRILPTEAIGQATLTLSGLPAGTDIVVLEAGTTNILFQLDAHPGTSYGYTYNVYTADTVVDIGFIKAGYVPLYIRNLTLARTNSSLPVDMRVDRNFT